MEAIKYLSPTAQMILFSALKIGVVFGVVMTAVAYAVLVERKVSAWIQNRVGPNRTAPFFINYLPVIGPFLVKLGIFQPAADGLKFLLKEDFTPSYVRKVYFWLAPAITVIPALLTVAVIPFSAKRSNAFIASGTKEPAATIVTCLLDSSSRTTGHFFKVCFALSEVKRRGKFSRPKKNSRVGGTSPRIRASAKLSIASVTKSSASAEVESEYTSTCGIDET